MKPAISTFLPYKLLLTVIVISPTSTTVSGSEKCDTCKTIISNFEKGLKDTTKSNFGGGNTAWEEKSLGSWQFSETRLVEIVEGLCRDAGKETHCHSLVEEYEEQIENYWFKHFAKNKDTDLHQYLCIERIKVCCINNTWGPKCTPCTGGKDKPCSGQGSCDGAGTREGNGKCSCNSGYKGELCNECSESHFKEEKNETHLTCTACDESCKLSCREAGPKGCDDCKEGWSENEEMGCIDLDECTEDNPCSENQFCTNNPGSYSCTDCDISCKQCTEAGPKSCIECNEGFNKENETCIDINECNIEPVPCTGKNNEECVNKPGTYSCECIEGYERINEQCVVKTVQEPIETNKEKENKDKDIDEGKTKKRWITAHGDYWAETTKFYFATIGVFTVLGIAVKGDTLLTSLLAALTGCILYWLSSLYEIKRG